MKSIFLLLICMVFLLPACEFAPSGTNYHEIAPTPVNNINIDIMNSSDTIYAKGWVQLNFKFIYPNKTFFGYQLQLDGKIIHESKDHNLSYSLVTGNYADGAHELKLMVLASSGTNSLADKLGVEAMQVYRTWVLIIDKGAPSAVKITKVSAENGTLKINWEKYKRHDIIRYEVTRHHYPSGNAHYTYELSPDKTSWTDPDYLGGNAYYSVTVVDSEYKRAASERILVAYNSPKILGYEFINENDLKITFSATRFHQNFGSYTLKTIMGAPDPYRTTSVTDTVVTIPNAPFGSGFHMQLYTVSKKDPSGLKSGAGDMIQIDGPGIAHQLGSTIRLTRYNSVSDLLYDLTSETISIVDAATMQLKQQKKLPTNVTAFASANLQQLYLQDQAADLQQLNPQTLEVLRSIKLRELVPGIRFTSAYFWVSNTNKMLINTRNIGVTTDTLFVVDMNSGLVELKRPLANGYYLNPAFSPDGNLVAIGNHFLKRQPDGTWRQTNAPYYNSITFHPKESQYLLKSSQSATLFSTGSDAPIKTFYLPQYVEPTYIDGATGYLVAGGIAHVQIYDMQNNRMLKEVMVRNSNNPGFFFKDKLINQHYYLPLRF